MKPRTWHAMKAIVDRADARHQRRYRQHGSWVALPVLEAMYFAKALHVALREREWLA